MRFRFLGGADEVGASCTLLEVGGKRLLIDAGIRMGSGAGSPLPELSLLQEVGELDAIVLTHAHTDHIGALPLVHLGYPGAPILATAPTKALTRVLLHDALRIMESRWEKEEEVPLYPLHAVEGMLSRMSVVGPGEPVPLCGGELTATYTPSGHVLGACSVMLDTPEGRILFAGDYSLDRQLTVEGMTIPRERPDVVITESTYGNRLHADRRGEEERLAASVAEVIGGGGKVLIPAFALGRAQEVILILLRAQKEGRIPRFPLYVDGMVRTICSVYMNHPEFLAERLRKEVAKHGNPFFYEGGAVSVLPRNRDAIAGGGPCAIVSSSGMLTGGPSQFYAERLIGDPKNAIFITGYQDEESPGRALLELADQVQEGGEGLLKLNGVARRVVCRVGRYGLSAHADAGQMLSVVCKLAPRDVFLVHGDDQARAAMASTMPATMNVHLPRKAQILELAPFRKKRVGKAVAIGIGGGRALDLEVLRATLVARYGESRLYTAQELTETWHGAAGPSEAQEMLEALPGASFEADRRRPFLFRAIATELEKRAAAAASHGFARKKSRQNGDAELHQALGLARKLFAAVPEFDRAGAHQAERTLTLHFHFPERVPHHRERIEQLARETGWKVEVSPRVNQKKLAEAARECLPLHWDLAKVSVFPEETRVRALVRFSPGASEDEKEAAGARFFTLTGRALEYEELGPPGLPVQLFDASGKMEQNAAFTLVKQGFQARGMAVFRCSQKTDANGAWLELCLISPQLAERHRDLLAELEKTTGWEIRVKPQPNQVAIMQRARQLAPLEWRISGQPSFFLTEGYLRVKTFGRPTGQEVTEVSERLHAETGYRLVVTPA